ncbi:MAG: FHA domain-containing protein [Armatimonadetes bacterium]|nr:FHA domain-containing protein [Armatimonadota bacterium]MDE2206632.1 FHA domain-containing protein [Armatimonadota bacterium]
MRSRILLGLLLGAVGGFVGYAVQEYYVNYSAHPLGDLSARDGLIFIVAVGGFIGLFLGLVDGVVDGSPKLMVRGALISAASGMALGYLGFSIGNALFTALGGQVAPEALGMAGFVQEVFARSVGWAAFGSLVGAGVGIGSLSFRKSWHGLIGGLVGGLAGGFVFDLAAQWFGKMELAATNASGVHDVGGLSRAIGLTAVGACTGFFTGLVEEILKPGWVRVMVGRNEGKDIILDRALNIMGRDEGAEVPLFGDNSVASQHAAIQVHRKQYMLVDAGTQTGTRLNGNRLEPRSAVPLRDGDEIRIGSHAIRFRQRAGLPGVGTRQPDTARSAPALAVAPGAAPGACPFCGLLRDARGNCGCTVGAPVAPAIAAPDTTSAGAPGEHRLTGIAGPYQGVTFALANGPNSVGRSAETRISLATDGLTSRLHATIQCARYQAMVTDNGSSNGTFVNGVRVQSQSLKPGDTLQFGESTFRFD